MTAYISLISKLLFIASYGVIFPDDSTVVKEAVTQPDTVPAKVADVDSLLRAADSMRLDYDFEASVRCYGQAESLTSDSLRRSEISDFKMLAENGLGMTDFVSEPKVVSKHKFPLKDFYLYYPLKDRSWRPLPNPLDTLGSHPFVNSMYVPQGSNEIFFSKADSEGIMNIYFTENRDTVWSLPALLNEAMTSFSDEIYPLLSDDGKTLYFASAGLYGMGGYDLYMSSWNEELQEWGPPSNMGIPYSSPYDDFLYMNTEDGKYSIFASNRECSKDSAVVYVLEFDNMPIRKTVKDKERLKTLALLEPDEDPSKMDNASAVSNDVPENEDIRKYKAKISEVRALRDSISDYGESLERDRVLFAESDDADEREVLTAAILRREAALPVMQDSLAKAAAALQKIEMEFLFSGVVLDPDELMDQADKEVEGASSNYVFAKMNYGEPLVMNVEKPKKEFDYSFMILPEGRFAEDNTLPGGIVYQIQMFSLSRPAKVSDIKGLSPVFEERSASGKYIYRVGVFRKYNDVLSNLNKVKRLGFKTAFIAAFENGKPMKVQTARIKEKEVPKEIPLYQIRITPGGGDLSDITRKAIVQMCSKDVAKMETGGSIVFTVGPFEDKAEAEKVEAAIKASGEMSVETVAAGVKKL